MATAITACAAELTDKEIAIVEIGAWTARGEQDKLGAAFKAGFVTSVLFCGWLKLCAVAQVGIANSSALYGSFAFLPIVLAWVYVSWQIVLLGSVMTYAFECVHLNMRSLPAAA